MLKLFLPKANDQRSVRYYSTYITSLFSRTNSKEKKSDQNRRILRRVKMNSKDNDPMNQTEAKDNPKTGVVDEHMSI